MYLSDLDNLSVTLTPVAFIVPLFVIVIIQTILSLSLTSLTLLVLVTFKST